MTRSATLVGLPPAPGPIEASGRRRDEARLLVVGPAPPLIGEAMAKGPPVTLVRQQAETVTLM